MKRFIRVRRHLRKGRPVRAHYKRLTTEEYVRAKIDAYERQYEPLNVAIHAYRENKHDARAARNVKKLLREAEEEHKALDEAYNG